MGFGWIIVNKPVHSRDSPAHSNLFQCELTHWPANHYSFIIFQYFRLHNHYSYCEHCPNTVVSSLSSRFLCYAYCHKSLIFCQYLYDDLYIISNNYITKLRMYRAYILCVNGILECTCIFLCNVRSSSKHLHYDWAITEAQNVFSKI